VQVIKEKGDGTGQIAKFQQGIRIGKTQRTEREGQSSAIRRRTEMWMWMWLIRSKNMRDRQKGGEDKSQLGNCQS
jgi:hypothetical protein